MCATNDIPLGRPPSLTVTTVSFFATLKEGDAKTFLSWIQIGTKFKQENLGNTAEEVQKLQLDKQRAARDAATRGLTDGGGGAK